MGIPGFTAETSLYRTTASYERVGASAAVTRGAEVVPQQCASTPCIQVGGGRVCVNLPIVGRRCVNVPSAGRWRIRCCLRFGIPPVSCSVQRC